MNRSYRWQRKTATATTKPEQKLTAEQKPAIKKQYELALLAPIKFNGYTMYTEK